jgi:hypothetical protein
MKAGELYRMAQRGSTAPGGPGLVADAIVAGMDHHAPSSAVDPAAITVLGAGYVGSVLLKRYPGAAATRRSATAGTHLFDLEDDSTWNSPPLAGRKVIWTFPAAPLERVRAFHGRCLREASQLIVLGSTSAYRVTEAQAALAPSIREDAPLDMSQPRVQGEEWLRSRGATVLRLAGIHGPGREPANWLRRGRIDDGARIVNLIHVDDIVDAISAVLEHPQPGRNINVADGEPLAWRELVRRLRDTGALPPDFDLPESGPGRYGKRIDTGRLRELMPEHVFRLPGDC